MESLVEDFEIVDVTHDDDRGDLSADVENYAARRQSSVNEDEDQTKNIVLSLKDFDLADFILDDLSPDDLRQQSDSEFSFVGLSEPHDGERERSVERDYAGPATPSSSAWSLLDYDFSSDSDVASSESIGNSPGPISDEDIEEEKTERIPPTCDPADDKRVTGRRRRKRKKNSDHVMLELFGGLSVSQMKEDVGLPGFVESRSGLLSSSAIPTLADLCMQKIHLYRKSHLIKNQIKSSDFPVGMRRTILSSNLQYSTTKSKLLWLCQNLAALESKVANYYKRNPMARDKKNFSFYCTSNIWKEMDNSVLIEACFKDDVNYRGCVLYENVEQYLVYTKLMAIMLANPSKYTEKKTRQNVRKFTKSKKPSKNAPSKHLSILHEFMKSRYPQLTAAFYNRSLPYAYWARGNFRGALQAFVTLYKQESLSDKEKLFIIGEIGRLYAMIYEPEKAVRMYRLLGNCLIQAKPWESETTECQTLVLITDLQNQGVFTESKSQNLIPAWKAVLRVCPSSRRFELYLEAAESLLCLHLGILQDGNHLEMVKSVLHEYSKYNDKIWYHLAFLNAITGDSKSSDYSYGEFLKSFNTLDTDDSESRQAIPGMQMVDLLSERKLTYHGMDAVQLAVQNPFEPLLSCGPVPAMKVIWRRQFHHCHGNSSSDECCNGFEISNTDLKLRMTTDSFITGDCSMIYPPIASVLLDPYTGSLMLEADTGGINPWKELPFTTAKTSIMDQSLNLPNMVELFHHEDEAGDTTAYIAGNHFFSEAYEHSGWWGYYGYSISTTTDQVINIHWNGPGGQRAKFSLVQKIKDYVYKDVVLEVQKSTTSENVREVTSIMEKWYRKGLAISCSDVSRVIQQLFDAKEKKKKIPAHRGYTPNKFWLKFTAPVRRVESSVLLTIHASQKQYYVIIECQDRNSFVNPVILEAGRQDTVYCSTRTANFCVERNDGKLTFYDCRGNILRTVSMTGPRFDKVTLIESNFIFSDRKSSRLGLLDVNNGSTRYFDDFLECAFVGVLLDTLILKNEYGVKFADGRQKCLKPMLIQLNSTLQRSNLPFRISENGEQLNGNFRHVTDLAEDRREMAAISVDNVVILFTVRTSQNSLREILLTNVLELPGLPVKLKFLHLSVGLLVTWTQHPDNDKVHGYREHLFQYSYSGQLLAVLPFLWRSRSSLCVAYLDKDTDTRNVHPACGRETETTNVHPACGREGWYLYLQDGRQGVMCVRLVQDEQ